MCITEIVDELDEESIKNSFKYCGISRSPHQINLHSGLIIQSYYINWSNYSRLM